MDGAVVVRGLGVLGAAGLGAGALAAALAEGRVVDHEVARDEGFHRRGFSRRAALAAQLDLSRVLPPLQARRMSPSSRFAVVAARLALADAGLPEVLADGERTAVCLATTLGPAQSTQRLLDEIFGGGPQTCSPLHFMESVANAPAAQVAIACGARGHNATITQRDAGALLTLAEARRLLLDGRADRVLAGVVDEVIPLNHAILNGFRALARAGAGVEEAARPFDARRNGFLLAEGAAIAVLERAEDAAAARARIHARVLGAARAFDASAPPAGFGDGAGPLARRAREAFARLGVDLAAVDRVVAGASGARQGDALEARVLLELFGRDLPPVLVPKAVTGEYGGGHFAAAILAASGAAFGAPPNAGRPDPALGVVPHDGRPLPPARTLLATSVAAGGAAAFVALGAPEEARAP